MDRGKPSGFTLVVDGHEDAVERIMRAVFDCLSELQREADAQAQRDELTFSPHPLNFVLRGTLPVHGRYEQRWLVP